jgi:hypothetical protein
LKIENLNIAYEKIDECRLEKDLVDYLLSINVRPESMHNFIGYNSNVFKCYKELIFKPKEFEEKTEADMEEEIEEKEEKQKNQDTFNSKKKYNGYKKRSLIIKEDVPNLLELLKSDTTIDEIKGRCPLDDSLLHKIRQVMSPNFLTDPLDQEKKELLKKSCKEHLIDILDTKIDECAIERDVLDLLLEKKIDCSRISKIHHIKMAEQTYKNLSGAYRKYVFLQKTQKQEIT